jgi:L-amino acid N-acyltransferase YncA
MNISIEPMTESDWPAVKKIYQDGIATGQATFAAEPPLSYLQFCDSAITAASLVARASDASVLGWARITRVSKRVVYAGVAEVSLYVAPEARGRRLGDALMRELIHRAETAGVWTLQASIFEENEASLALHRRHGFRVVGRRERIGLMPSIGPRGGAWRDTLLLERRSAVVGKDP